MGDIIIICQGVGSLVCGYFFGVERSCYVVNVFRLYVNNMNGWVNRFNCYCNISN